MKRMAGQTMRSCCALALWLCALAAPAQEKDDAVTTHVFRLQPVRGEFSFLFAHIDDGPSTRTIAKPPAFVSSKTRRGVLRFGDAPDDSLDLYWDHPAGKLALDLNRNGDLTDDSVFDNRGEKELRHVIHKFNDIPLVSPRGPQYGRYVADIQMNKFPPGSMNGIAMTCTGWESEIELHGRKYCLTFAQGPKVKPEGRALVVLRPAGKPYHKMYELTNLPKHLFLDGHLYETSFEMEPAENGGVVIARLAERPIALGELEIKGEHVARLVLKTGERFDWEPPGLPPIPDEPERPVKPPTKKPVLKLAAIFDEPRGKVKIPAATYTNTTIYLDGGTSVGVFSSEGSAPDRIVNRRTVMVFPGSRESLSIAAGTTTVLRMGEPLKNVIKLNRLGWGRIFRLSYELQGAGGETYLPGNMRESPRPQFAAYKNNKKIASGSFEYG